MQISVIAILIFLVPLAASAYYWGFYRPTQILAWRAKATFTFTTFVFMPALIAALYLQHGAPQRLRETGIVPHPALGRSVGLAVGVSPIHSFLFETTAPRDSLFAFYRDAATHPGWTVTTDSPLMLILKRGRETVAIAEAEGWRGRSVVYQFSP